MSFEGAGPLPRGKAIKDSAGVILLPVVPWVCNDLGRCDRTIKRWMKVGKAHDMKTKLGLFSLLFRLAKDGHARRHRLLARLLRDEEGAWLISATIYLAGADRCRGP